MTSLDGLELGIDLRTSDALRRVHAASASDVGLSALVRAMRTFSESGDDAGRRALARELVWCALVAAREDRVSQVLDAAHALRVLAAVDTPSDRIGHG